MQGNDEADLCKWTFLCVFGDSAIESRGGGEGREKREERRGKRGQEVF